MKKKNIVLLLSGIFLFILLIAISTNKINFIDEKMYEVIDSIRRPFLDYLFVIVTMTLDGAVVLLLSLLCFFLFGRKKGMLIFINLGVITIFSHLLKFVFQRPRPEVNLIGETGYSLPSAHACVGLAFFGFIAYLIYCFTKTKKMKIGIITIATIFILLIGLSRIYLGAHYFSDILSGYLIGTIYLLIYVPFLKRKNWLE